MIVISSALLGINGAASQLHSVEAVFIAGVLCFASFAWGMARHFKTGGKPSYLTVVVALFGPLLAVLSLASLWKNGAWHPIPAITLYTASLLLFWSAVSVTKGKQFDACFLRSAPRHLVIAGPFHWIRHPFYSSYIATWIGCYFATGWWLLGIGAGAMIYLYELAARQEEARFRQGPLAEEYRIYQARTGRFLPGL